MAAAAGRPGMLRGGVTKGAEVAVSQWAKATQLARTRARERRLTALDDGRALREERIAAATAEVYLRTEESGGAGCRGGCGGRHRLGRELKVAEVRRTADVAAGHQPPPNS